MKNYLTIGLHAPRKIMLKLVILYFAVYTFYYVIQMTAQVQYGHEDSATVLVFFNFSAALSLSFIWVFLRRIRKTRILYAWALLSIGFIILLSLTTRLIEAYVLSSAIGFLFGIATWAFSLYFINETVVEERGRLGGLATSITLLAAPFFISVAGASYGVYVFLGLLILLTAVMKPEEKPPDTKAKALMSLFRSHGKDLLLYLLPWLILCINNSTFIPLVEIQLHNTFHEYGIHALLLKYLSAGMGAIGLGVLMDWRGRKAILIFGFSILGVAACLSGLIPNLPSYLFFSIVSGLAWSPLLVLYLLIVWDEVAHPALSPIYFSLGLAIYHVAKGLGTLLTPRLPIGAYEAALINASLMFLSVLHIVYAPNLLPSDVKERMHFHLYRAQVKKRLQPD
jgi:hypothetical protein